MDTVAGFGILGILAGGFGVYWGLRTLLQKDYFAQSELRIERQEAERNGVQFDAVVAKKRIEKREADGWRSHQILSSLLRGPMIIIAGLVLLFTSFKDNIVPASLLLVSVACLMAVALLNNRTQKLTPIATVLLWIGLALFAVSFVA